MEMRNKTSDENVANIEDDVELVKRYLENSAYKESESNFFKNGGWEMVDLEIPKAMANILAEREQKDKRIKELEEENALLKKASNIAKDVNIDDVTHVINKSYEDFVKNYIPKQVVRDKIEELKLSGGSDGKDNVENLVRELTIEIIQEILEGEK